MPGDPNLEDYFTCWDTLILHPLGFCICIGAVIFSFVLGPLKRPSSFCYVFLTVSSSKAFDLIKKYDTVVAQFRCSQWVSPSGKLFCFLTVQQ